MIKNWSMVMILPALAIASVLMLMSPQLALATDVPADTCVDGRGFFDFVTWDEYLEHEAGEGCRIANFEFPQDLFLVLLALVDMMIRLSVFVAVGFIIYGGFRFMGAQGNPDQLGQAKKVIAEAITGLIIAVLATTIISFVATRF